MFERRRPKGYDYVGCLMVDPHSDDPLENETAFKKNAINELLSKITQGLTPPVYVVTEGLSRVNLKDADDHAWLTIQARDNPTMNESDKSTATQKVHDLMQSIADSVNRILERTKILGFHGIGVEGEPFPPALIEAMNESVEHLTNTSARANLAYPLRVTVDAGCVRILDEDNFTCIYMSYTEDEDGQDDVLAESSRMAEALREVAERVNAIVENTN